MSREKRSRRQFTTEQTAAILRRHLVDKTVSVHGVFTQSSYGRPGISRDVPKLLGTRSS